jgi:hypothetical protein
MVTKSTVRKRKPVTEKEEASAKALNLIASAAVEAAKVIASSALDATKVIANSAADATKVMHDRGAGDHDTLLVLVASVDNLEKKFSEKFADIKNDIKADIKDLKDTNSCRISALEVDKLNVKDSYPVLYKVAAEKVRDDHEVRIRSNEKNITKIVTIGGVLLVLLGIAEFLMSKFL